ncbi:MAG: hypothetical protein JJ895_07870 [Balneolaceae bacterium]|nr:hypothetical protein [Balneolaceae bacterium]
MKIQYLEIVSNDVQAVCDTYSTIHSVTFSEPVEGLGNALTTTLSDGSMIGVRKPMHETEVPTIRPYWLVKDVQKAYDLALNSGATEAHPPLEIPGIGKFAIYINGDIMQGLWQNI